MYWITNLEGGPKRVNHAAVKVKHYIYSFGGFDRNINFEELSPMSIYQLNTVTLRWSEVKIHPTNYVFCPYERYGHTAVEYGTDVIVWGGRNDNNACNTIYIFDTCKKEWRCPEVTGSIPLPRDGHTACIINDRMYIFGGFLEDLNCFCDDVHYLDLKTMEWKYVNVSGDRPEGRDFHSAPVIGSKMYILGGRGESPENIIRAEKYWSSVYYLDTDTHTWHKPNTHGKIPIGRRSLSTFVYNGCIYMFGGCNGKLNKHFNDLHVYNPETNEWKEVKTLGTRPSERRRQGCVKVGDRVFIFCGSRPKSCCTESVDDYSVGDYSVEDYLVDDFSPPMIDLEDLGDMSVLQLGVPSLKTLCCIKVIDKNMRIDSLPVDLQQEIKAMSVPNNFPV